MSGDACTRPIPLPELVAYERGELGELDDARVEEHLFSCASCAARLGTVEDLARGIAALVAAGQVTTGATSALLDEAARRGVPVRAYRLDPGDVVPCTCSPDDAFVAVRFAADVAPGDRADLEVATTMLATGEVISSRQADLVIDHAAGEVVVFYAGDAIRAAPRSRWEMHLRVRSEDGSEPVLGPYTLDHTPWAELEERD